MTRRVLTPVEVTERYPSFGTGRLETWAAVSKDGLWKYDRIEDTGTPWSVCYVPTNEYVIMSSLPKAQAATADGSALRLIIARRKEVA